jgi:hypothetical protein
MAIVPDTKNWTWVLERPCPECGFDASTTDEHDVADLLRANVAEWPAVLERTDVRVRPDESTWSALEYAAHVRDVFRLFAHRLDLMLTRENPTFPDWDQDATAVEENYGEQDPRVVATELVAAGTALAAAFDAVPGDDWTRRGRRGDGAEFTVATFARYLIHDPVHHLWDVRRQPVG